MGHDSQLQSHIEGVCFTTYKCLIRHNERLLQFMPALEFFRQQVLQLKNLFFHQVLTVKIRHSPSCNPG